jgi:hypothetical protein
MTFARAARLMLASMLVGLAGADGSATKIGAGSPEQIWTEMRWPFLLDEWGTGQAFGCEQKGCGPEARLFIRVKRGFCNCLQGVADDAEVDRLTDFAFLGGPSRPLGSGQPVTFGDMSGRVRAFAIDRPEAPTRRAVSLVVAKDCDALVATIISDRAVSLASDSKIVDLLPPTILANLR